MRIILIGLVIPAKLISTTLLQEQLLNLNNQLSALVHQINIIKYSDEYEQHLAQTIAHAHPSVLQKYGGKEKYKEQLRRSLTLQEFIDEQNKKLQEEEIDKQRMILFKPEQERLMLLLKPTEEELYDSTQILYPSEYQLFKDIKNPIHIRNVLLNVPILRTQNYYAKQLLDRPYRQLSFQEKNDVEIAMQKAKETIDADCLKELTQLIDASKNDNIAMISLGSYVGPFLYTWEFDAQTIKKRNQDAINQQIPDFIEKASQQYPTTAISIFLFDPLFYNDHDIPRALRIKGSWQLTKKTDSRIQIYKKDNIQIVVLPCILDDSLGFLFRDYIRRIFEHNGAIFIYYYSADFIPKSIIELAIPLFLAVNPNRIVRRNFSELPNFKIEKKNSIFYIVPVD